MNPNISVENKDGRHETEMAEYVIEIAESAIEDLCSRLMASYRELAQLKADQELEINEHVDAMRNASSDKDRETAKWHYSRVMGGIAKDREKAEWQYRILKETLVRKHSIDMIKIDDIAEQVCAQNPIEARSRFNSY